MPPARSPVAEIFAALDRAFRDLGGRWYLFGAQAALLYGVTRVTADVDVTFDPGGREIDEIVRRLATAGFSSRTADPRAMADRMRVLPVVHVDTAIPVDIILAGPGLEMLFLSRVEMHEIGGLRVPVARAEDLIAMKILAGRPKDFEDVVAVLAAAPRVDLGLVRETLALLEQALSRSDLVPHLEQAIARARGR